MQPILRTTFSSLLIAGIVTGAAAGPAIAAAPLDGAAATAAIARIVTAAFVAEHAAALSASCEGRDDARDTCAKVRGRVADVRRAAIYAEMAKRWDTTRRAAFARLLDAQELFARAVGDFETDHMPTDASFESVRAQQTEKGAFLVLLRSVVGGTTRVQFVDYAETDSALNAAYAQVMASRDTATLAWGTVEKGGIRRTQRSWLAYRDAFTAFAATFGPDVAESVKAELTTRRAMSLEGLLAD